MSGPEQHYDVELNPDDAKTYHRHFQVVETATERVSHVHTSTYQATLIRVPIGYHIVEIDVP